ncbi:hypothetical protein ACIFOT_04590 [Neobacillus sp. NRS-1170]|uniref:hypothetical protein n=1 Tax=Neobacillus sp. NRS-1170 TaxID=3233898 RepID=UPI003D2C8AD3
MGLCNDIVSVIQVKVFEETEELNCWLKEAKDLQILDIKFRSMVIIDEIVIRDRFVVIYK